MKHYKEKHPDKEVPDSVLTNVGCSEQEPSTEEILAALDNLDKNAIIQGHQRGFPLLAGASNVGGASVDYEVGF